MKSRNAWSKRLRAERGGAMVELTVLMLVFVPLILLPMYFQDAMRYKLDTQEAVYSTAWDFSFADYENQSVSAIKGSIESANRNIYKNLWSGNARAKKDPAGPWADFNWREELSCSAQKGFGADYPDLAMAYHGRYTKGGLVTCKGSISVANHYVPKAFVQQSAGDFAEQELFEHGKSAIDYRTYEFGVMVDPWTIHNPSSMIPEAGGADNLPFYQRVDFVWKNPSTYNDMKSGWEDFANAMSSKLSKDKSSLEQNLDDPMKLKMAAAHDSGFKFSRFVQAMFDPDTYNTTPYEDGSDDNYKETYNTRKKFFMGCTSYEFTGNCK